MSFTNLSGTTVLLGLAGLAAALFLVQRLRVRQREVVVVTTLFWREALEDARARVLLERFRHPLAYLLLLALAACLWLGVAGPRLGSDPERGVVLLLDGSAGMARAGRFEAALEELRAQVEREPRGVTRALWCGAEVRTLLAPGEPARTLEPRLDGLGPETAPASLARALLGLAATGDSARAIVIGDGPVAADVLARCASVLDVSRAPLDGPALAPNRGVVALGVGEARSGAWDRVDVSARVAGDGDAVPRATLDGAPLATAPEVEEGPLGTTSTWRDVPAAGGVWTVALAGEDALGLDDAGSIALPNRPRVRVELAPGLPPSLGAALASDPAVELVDAAPDVLVTTAGDARADGLPALVVDALEAGPAFRVADASVALVDLVRGLALDRIDATTLANELERPLEVVQDDSPIRRLTVWASLFDARYDLAQSRALPVLVGAAVRWLGDVEPFARTSAVGDPAARGVFTAPHGAHLDPVGAAFVPAVAGLWADAAGRPFAAALVDAAVTRPPADEVPAAADDGPRGARDVTALFALLALALMLGDAWLHRSGRMP